MVYTKIQ